MVPPLAVVVGGLRRPIEERRKFVVKAGGILAASAVGAAVDALNVIARPKFQWRMSTTWTPALDVLQGSAQRLARLGPR